MSPYLHRDRSMDGVGPRVSTPEPINNPPSQPDSMVASSADLQAESTIAPYYTGLNGVNETTNMLCRNILWGSLGVVVLILLVLRIMEMTWNKTRQSAVLSTPQDQEYWKRPRTSWTSTVKKHLIYASVWTKRHHREFRLFSVNLGTLPSRLHIIFIGLYIASNIVYLFTLDWHNPNRYVVCAELRGRSGTLCVANMVPLIILAGRNNPLTPLLKISFDTYNLFHRWIGRLAVVQIIIHAIAWTIPVVADGGWGYIGDKISGSVFIASGLASLLSMSLMLLLSLSPIRHAFYETFLDIHILLAIIAFAGTWVHCVSSEVPGGLPQLPWIMAVVYLWVADRLARFARTLYMNWSGRVVTTAFCEAMPGDITRVTLHLPRNASIKPGSHAYLRFWGVNAWESHPFSIAWTSHNIDPCLPVSEAKPDRVKTTTSVSFIISAHAGATRKLFNKATACRQGLRLKATMEGPYSGYHSLDSYGHVVLIAGAGGITHMASYLRPLLEGSAAGTVATQRLTLMWVIRDLQFLEWIQPHLDALRLIPHSDERLRVVVFVTRLNTRDEIPNTNPTVRVESGRPDLPLFVANEIKEQIGAMCINVCGSGSLADDVRDVVRAAQGETIVDFIEESFTW